MHSKRKKEKKTVQVPQLFGYKAHSVIRRTHHIQRCLAAEYKHATKDANFSAQERLDGRRRYVLSPHCFIFREGTFRAGDKHDSRNSKLYCCHRYHVTEHVLLSTYANFHLFAFLLKSFSILKVSKGSILFLIHWNKGVDQTQSSLVHRRPKSSSQIVILRFCYVKILGYKTHPNLSTNLPPKDRFFLKKPCAL